MTTIDQLARMALETLELPSEASDIIVEIRRTEREAGVRYTVAIPAVKRSRNDDTAEAAIEVLAGELRSELLCRIERAERRATRTRTLLDATAPDLPIDPRCSEQAPTIGGGSTVRCGLGVGHVGPHVRRGTSAVLPSEVVVAEDPQCQTRSMGMPSLPCIFAKGHGGSCSFTRGYPDDLTKMNRTDAK